MCSEVNNYFTNVASNLNKSKYTNITPPDYNSFLNTHITTRLTFVNRSDKNVKAYILR